MVARRTVPAPDRNTPRNTPVGEILAAIYLHFWVDRHAALYGDLLTTIAHAPRPVS